jgi:hypothetical protein
MSKGVFSVACVRCGRLRPASFRDIYALPNPADDTRCPACGHAGGPSPAIFFLARLGAFAAVLVIGRPIAAALHAPGATPLGPMAIFGAFLGLIAAFYIAHVVVATALNLLVSVVKQGRAP